jgi:hypothetical protein
MRNGLIVTGVLGFGTVAVFALAALASAAFPQGGTVAGMWNGGWNGGGGMVIAKPMPAPGVVWNDSMGGGVIVDGNTSGGSAGGVEIAPPDAGGFPVTPSDAPPAE